ncbi:serine hydrolase domain-containing protein [Streptomyces sp. TRM 70361]|uniref:serine hydrolase domain-containing protein n=1 Tax=Streptomyces sp. TRM 70361 TaxID=3116553 RepID=UPI002E7BA5D0|nr:serine hydrolase domain-containing protein [Streptomyces sp. TRM 70361]MEE1941364.1 serine hydrolase domain-containing protein [Streptomyces sp. TRM 70361]
MSGTATAGPDPAEYGPAGGSGLGLGARLAAVADTASGPAAAVVAVRAGEPAVLCRGVTEATRFELGSVTKTFTALLLAELAARGEVRADEPIAGRLPGLAVPRGLGDRITFEHLATHTAGLPRLPPGLLRRALPRWFTNPYETFTPEHLLRSLPRVRVRRPPGERVRYSNLGVGLLGQLLGEAVRAGHPDLTGHPDPTGYAAALTARVLAPLGLADTTCDPELPQATGHFHHRPRPPWRIPGLPGAGALRSSPRDLLRYLTVLLDPPDGPAQIPGTLRTALHDVIRPRITEPGGDRVCLVWKSRLLTADDGTLRELLFHSGGTRGFTSFAGFSPTTGTALAALTNGSPTLRGTFIHTAYRTLRELALETPPRQPPVRRPETAYPAEPRPGARQPEAQ